MSEERVLGGMEEAILETLREQAALDPSLFLLTAGKKKEDVLESFGKEYPNQFLAPALSAKDTVLFAAGLALSGRKVWIHSPSPLPVFQAYDALRAAIAIPSLPVSFLLTNAGLTGGEDGTMTQVLEDLAFLRALPNVSIVVPSDGPSAGQLVKEAIRGSGPYFFRLCPLPLPELPRPDGSGFQPGGASILREGDGVTLCACGTMVHEALKASAILCQQGIEAEVIDCYSVKPLPAQAITASVRRTGCCVVAEEHSSSGGLGGAMAELVCQSSPVPVKFVSVQDRFGQSGGAEELLEYYGLSFKEILSAASQAWTMRRR